jgi:hypothetical protein
MPNNLLYTQGLAILLGEAVTLDAIEELLTDFTIVNQSEESTSWPLSGPSLTVAYRPEVNGTPSARRRTGALRGTVGNKKIHPSARSAERRSTDIRRRAGSDRGAFHGKISTQIGAVWPKRLLQIKATSAFSKHHPIKADRIENGWCWICR